MWLNQEFSFLDIPTLLFLILLECLLSADNALVMASVVKPLEKKERKKALWIGIFSAFILRGAVIALAAFLIKNLYVQAIGALYLVYLSFSLRRKKRGEAPIKTTSLWKTILVIEGLDLIFAIDSIVAALGLVGAFSHTGSTFPPKLWIVYFGGIFGLLIMRCSVQIFSFLIDRFPKLERASHYLIGWIGLKLAFETFMLAFFPEKAGEFHFLEEAIFWTISLLLFLSGFIPERTKRC